MAKKHKENFGENCCYLRISDIENKYRLTHNILMYKTDFSPKACIYARVSTKKQEDNLNRQIERLRQHCKEKGYNNPI